MNILFEFTLIYIGLGLGTLLFSIAFNRFEFRITNPFKSKGKLIGDNNTHITSDMFDEENEEDFIEAIQSQQFYKDLDARIERMKMEMAEDNMSDFIDTVAQEMHPMVKNIPHDEVKKFIDLADGDEVSE